MLRKSPVSTTYNSPSSGALSCCGQPPLKISFWKLISGRVQGPLHDLRTPAISTGKDISSGYGLQKRGFQFPLMRKAVLASKMRTGSSTLLLHPHRVGYGQLVAAFCPARRDYLPATVGAHTAAKTMFIDSFSATWLKCPFHC